MAPLRPYGPAVLQRLLSWLSSLADPKSHGRATRLLGLELVQERGTKTPANAAAERVLYRALSRGLSFKTTMGNVLTLTPPLTVTPAQMDQALDILDECLAAESA